MKVNHNLVLASTILASGMAFLSGTSISIALPTIQTNFQTTITGLQWIVNAYVLTLAVLILISGSLGDIFGRKRIFSYGIVGFMVGAVLSGMSQNITQLIIFQGVQGVGAAMMIPGSLAIINSCIPKETRGRAIGLWAGLSGGIATLGPLAGGWLVQTLGWRSVFFVNVPFGILALLFTMKFVPESKNPDARKIDWIGTILIGVGLSGVSFSLISGPVSGWFSPTVAALGSVGVISLIGFFIVEKRVEEPLVPFDIFTNRAVLGANISTLFLYMALNGVIFFLVLNFQQFQGYSPLIAGMGLLPPIVIITFLSGPAGSVADKRGPKNQMVIGSLIVSLAMFLLSIPGTNADYITEFLLPLSMFGFGMSIIIAPLTKTALSVDEKFSGVASGINNAISRIAALLAIAVFGIIVISLFTSQLTDSINNSQLDNEQKSLITDQSNKLGGIEIPEDFSEEQSTLVRSIINESFIYGFRWSMRIGAGLAFLSAIVSFTTLKSKVD